MVEMVGWMCSGARSSSSAFAVVQPIGKNGRLTDGREGGREGRGGGEVGMDRWVNE